MALTAEDHQSLIDAGLVKYFGKHRRLYTAMAREAYNYAKGAVDATGLPVRVDDVIKVFEPALSIEPTLREYLAGAKLTQKYWTKRFGNYVLDQLWGRLNHDQKEGD